MVHVLVNIGAIGQHRGDLSDLGRWSEAGPRQHGPSLNTGLMRYHIPDQKVKLVRPVRTVRFRMPCHVAGSMWTLDPVKGLQSEFT